jgi:cell wall-associated NlpC family hydrolase
MRRTWLARTALVLLPAAAAGGLTTASTLTAATTQPPPAYQAHQTQQVHPITAHLTADTESIGNRILDEAETRAGDWYVYGGAGPSVFDCSGLVYWASHRLGVNMPRTTYGMLTEGVSSGLLYQVSNPQRGDLAFYGTGHVEFVTDWWHTTFGAQDTGTRVGWHTWNAYWHPTMYFRIR